MAEGESRTFKRDPEGWREGFRCANLPKSVFDTLRQIAVAHQASQRQVVVAGIVALSYLSEHDRKALGKVWETTLELCPTVAPRTPPATGA